MDQDSVSFSRALGLHLRQPLLLDTRPVLRAAPGAVVMRAGDPVQRLPFLLQGRLEGVMHLPGDAGAQVVPVGFGVGEIALLSTLFGDAPSPIDLVAREPLQWCWIERVALETALQSDPHGLLLLARFLGARLREVQQRERGWVGRGVRARVGAVLRRMLREVPQVGPGRPVRLAITHERLADRCGLSRPRTSLALKALEKAGVLRLGRGQIEIMNHQALEIE